MEYRRGDLLQQNHVECIEGGAVLQGPYQLHVRFLSRREKDHSPGSETGDGEGPRSLFMEIDRRGSASSDRPGRPSDRRIREGNPQNQEGVGIINPFRWK